MKNSYNHELPFSEEEMRRDPILTYFNWAHLPTKLANVSREFYRLARYVVDNVERSPERTVALRKLLESKDAAVRAAVGGEPSNE